MNYILHKYKDSYLSIEDIEVVQFPMSELLFNGIQIDTGYQYVSNTYLNGFINYVKVRNAFMTFEYGYDEREETLKKIESILEKQWYHSDLGQFGESVVVIGEIEDSYMTFIYDGDVSDCSIYRYSKEKHSYNEVLEDAIGMMKYRQEFENPECNEYVELPLPQGWIKY